MKFSDPLKKGLLLKRYKRFFADIESQKEVLKAHLPNTGSLKTVPLSDTSCYFSSNDDPKRKLKHTLELIEAPSGLVGVNTRTPNIIAGEYLNQHRLEGQYENVQSEVKISPKSRIDFVTWEGGDQKKLKFPDYLEDPALKLHFVEVKNVTMAEGETALFPDGVSTRALKHLEELIHLKKQGHRAEILFVVQREGVKKFRACEELDPDYAKKLKEAYDKGVKVTALQATLSPEGVELTSKHLEVMV